MINIDKDIIHRTIKEYGCENQVVAAIEEMSELQKELCKTFRIVDNRKEIVEELADVLIMLGDIKQIFDISDGELNEIIKSKQKRVLDRIEQA